MGSGNNSSTLVLDNLNLVDIVDIGILQDMQDSFADAFNIASIIYAPDGTAITNPSHFSEFCSLVRSTEKGNIRCQAFDAQLIKQLAKNKESVIRHNCHLKGLVTATVPIVVEGKHFANWGIGQTLEKELDFDEVRRCSQQIGMDPETLIDAAGKLKTCSETDLQRVLNFLEIMAKQISQLGLNNLQQGHYTARHQQLTQQPQDSEKRYQALFDNLADGIVMLHLESGKFAYANKAFCQMLGYTPDEIKKLGYKDIHPPADLDRVADAIDKQVKKELITAKNIPVKRKDGSVFHADINSNPIQFAGQKYLLGDFRDITERKQIVDLLRQSEQRYRGLFDESLTAAYVFDAKKNFVDANQAGLELLGYSRDELLKMSIPDVDADPVAVLPAHKQLLLGNRLVNYEHQLRRKDGTIITVLNNSCPLTDNQGKVIGMQSTLIDITTRKQTQAELQEHKDNLEKLLQKRTRDLYESEDKYHLTMETAIVGIYIVQDMTFKYVNPTMAHFFGYEQAEVENKIDPADLVIPEHREMVRQNIIKRLSGKQIEPYDIKCQRKDGSIFDAMVWGKLITYQNRPAIVGTLLDITERKRTEEELRVTKGNLEATLNALPDLMFEMDSDGQIFDYRAPHFELLYVPPETFLGKKMTEVLPEPASGIIMEALRQALEMGHSEGSTYSLEIHDQTHWFELSIARRRNAEVSKDRFVMLARDITKRKLAEEQLRQSKQRFQNLAETTSDWIWEVDTDGVYTYTSPGVKRLLGYEPQEIIGKRPFDFMPPKEQKRVSKDFKEYIKNQQPFIVYENTAIHKDGHRVIIETSGVPFFDEAGKLVGYRGIDRDITKRKQSEKKLQHTLKQLCEAQKLAHLGSYEGNFQTGESAWSDEMYHLFGYEPDEIPCSGEAFYNLVYPADRKIVEKLLEESMSTQQPCQQDFRLIRKDGEIRTINMVGEFTYDKDGQPLLTRGIFQDITERKKIEEELKRHQENLESLVDERTEAMRESESLLREKQEQLELILRHSSDGINMAEYDMQTRKRRLVLANKRYVQMSGRSRKELMETESLDDFVTYPAPIDVRKQWYSFIKELKTYSGIASWIRPDGKENYYEWTAAPVEHDGKKYIIGIDRDVTQQKKIEDELRVYHEKISHLERLSSIGTLTAGISHQLSQPLTVAQMLLQDTLENCNSHKIKSCRDAVADLTEVLHELFNITDICRQLRGYSYTAPTSVETVNLSETLNKIMKVLNSNAQLSKIKMTADSIDPLLSIEAHIGDIEQIFFVLIQNAIQAADGKQWRELIINAAIINEGIQLTLRDNCGGIKRADLNKVFEPFFTTKPREVGTGLGLPIIKRILDRLQGTISADSKPGKGTTFTVILPVNP